MSSRRSIAWLIVVTLTLFLPVWAAGQVPDPVPDAPGGPQGTGSAVATFSTAVMERGCFSYYATEPSRTQTDEASIRAAGEDISIAAGTTRYVEIDTLVVIYPHYNRTYAGGRVDKNLSAADIEILKTEAAEANRFLWRSSNLKCIMNLHWMVVDRTLTPAQLWEVSDDAYWLTYWSIDGSTSVERDLRNAGVASGRYSVVIVLYAFENSDGAGAAYGGGAYGVDIGFLGDTAYIAIPLAWGLDCDGYITHEYLHALDSIYTASGNPRGNDMGHADQPDRFPYPADGGRHFNYLLANTLDPQSWFWLNTAWARTVTASDNDSDGVPDRGMLPITEETMGSSTTRSDTDGDGLDDLGELVASFIGELNPLHPDTDGDGQTDLQDPYPLYQCNEQVPKGRPQVDGVIGQDEYARIARLPVSGNADLETSVYAAWSDGMLYLAADATDNIVEAPYQDPFWHFDDNFGIDIDALRDGWLTGGHSNYNFFFVPTGGQSRPRIFGRYGSRGNSGQEWRDIGTTGIQAAYRLRHGGYTIEAAIPASTLSASGNMSGDVPLSAGSTVRATFSVRDHDAYGDWPSLNILTGRDEDVRGFVAFRLADAADPGRPFDGCGTLIRTGTGPSACTLFQADTDVLYSLDNLGGFAVGARVRVQGTIKTVCGSTPCERQAQGCIAVTTISSCDQSSDSDCDFEPGDRVVLRVRPLNQDGTLVAGLYPGAMGTVVCRDNDDLGLPLFVSWDNWTGGKSNSSYCDPPVIPYTPNSGWWMACGQIARPGQAAESCPRVLVGKCSGRIIALTKDPYLTNTYSGCNKITLQLNFKATLSAQVSGTSAAGGTWSATLDSTTVGPGTVTVKLCLTGTNVNAGALPCAQTSEVASVTLSMLPASQ